MKTFVLLVLTVAALFLWQRKSEQAAAARTAPNRSVVRPQPTAVSEHNWAKNSLDRAHETIEAVRTAQTESQEP